jgi:hypothetical protein
VNGIGFNLTTIAIAWVAGSVILVPLLIAGVRFALVPLLDTLARYRAAPSTSGLDERLARIEAGIARLARERDDLGAGSAGRTS